MREIKRTPGPWTAVFSTSFAGLDYFTVDGPPGWPAVVDAEAAIMGEPDACLIAAAPELLESGGELAALIGRAQEILTRHIVSDNFSSAQAISAFRTLLDGPEQRSIQSAWDAAIAKAEGKP